MDERIMKVLEAAGARIADLEADLAEYKDANTYVCGQRDAALDEIKGQRDAALDEIKGQKAEIERLNKSVDSEKESANYWYKEYIKLEKSIKALTADRANVEAVD